VHIYGGTHAELRAPAGFHVLRMPAPGRGVPDSSSAPAQGHPGLMTASTSQLVPSEPGSVVVAGDWHGNTAWALKVIRQAATSATARWK
jgi:hypothetical protein